MYRQEIAAEEDVYRTLPFFGAALGIVVAALAYAAGRLPKWPDIIALGHGRIAFGVAALLLLGSIAEAVFVLFFMSRAILRRGFQRIGPESALRTRAEELRAYYEGMGIEGEAQDAEVERDIRQTLLDSYTVVPPTNRALNEIRYRFRAVAASCLIRSLFWALTATSIIFVTDKMGVLPKAIP